MALRKVQHPCISGAVRRGRPYKHLL